MTTPLSCLQLRHHAFSHVSVHANEKGSLENEPVLTPQIRFQPVADEKDAWQLVLRVDLHSANEKEPFAYEASAVIQAELGMTGDYEDGKMQELAIVNGTGILYGAVREMFLNLTCRATNGQISLPVLDFREIVRNAISEKAKAKQPSQKKK